MKEYPQIPNEIALSTDSLKGSDRHRSLHLQTAEDLREVLQNISDGKTSVANMSYTEAKELFVARKKYSDEETNDEIRKLFGIDDFNIVWDGKCSLEMLSALEITALEENFEDPTIGELWDDVMQGGEFSPYSWGSADSVVDHIERVVENEKISSATLQDFQINLANSIDEHPNLYEKFSQELVARIDMNDVDSFHKNMELLETIRLIEQQNRETAKIGELNGFNHGDILDNEFILSHNSMKESLASLRGKGKGSFLLNAKINHIIETEVQYDKYGDVALDNTYPFYIAENRIAVPSSDKRGMLVTRGEDFYEANESLEIVNAYRDLRVKQRHFLEQSYKYFAEQIDGEIPSLDHELNPRPHSLFSEGTELDSVDYLNTLDEIVHDLARNNPGLHQEVKGKFSEEARELHTALKYYNSMLGERSYNTVETKLYILLLEGGELSEEELLGASQKGGDDHLRLRNYESMLSEFTRNYIQDNFSIELKNLTIMEQGYFLNFLKTRTLQNVEGLQLFTQKYKADGARAFLSLEHGGQEMGNKILTIGEEYPQEIANKIFAKYGEIVDIANNAEELLKEEFANEDQAIIRKTAENLLLRGKALLSLMADSDSLTEEDVLNKINKLKDEVTLFTSGVKALSELNEKFTLKELAQSHFEIISGPELSAKGTDVIDHMKEIYLKNYEGEKFTDAFRQTIMDEFERRLEDPNTRFYILKHEGQIVAFNSFTDKEDNAVHFASFNVDPQYAHAQLGEAMMEVSLDKEAKNAVITCAGVPDAPITQTYLKRGFEKVKEIDVGGVTLWEMQREKTE